MQAEQLLCWVNLPLKIAICECETWVPRKANEKGLQQPPEGVIYTKIEKQSQGR